MAQRKYFGHKITDLEDIYSSAGDDCAVLEELEEELQYRSTQRAKKLLNFVQGSLNGNDHNIALSSVELSVVPDGNNSNLEQDKTIDWQSVLSDVADVAANSNEEIPVKSLNNHPKDIIDTWIALEALSPQIYKKPNDLIVGHGSVVYLNKGNEPWLKGEKSRPKHQLYYVVYLGAINLEQATEKLLKKYQDKRIERPSVRGLASIGVVILNKNGIPVPETGLALSSFGWAYARALNGNLNELEYWEAVEKLLKEGLEKIIYHQDDDRRVLPFSFEKVEQVFKWLVKNCGIPEQDATPPSFAIRLYQHFNKGEPEPPLLNSFFLDDLQRAKSALKSNTIGKALSQYLGITKPQNQYDVLKNKSHIEEALQPRNMPLGRWPGKGRYPLVLLQQTAVNLAIKDLSESGLFSVNGPPGTGKTTLLRDVVAAVLVDRAKALYAFKDTNDAFEHSGQMKLGNGFVHLYKLDETLRGHEMVVASTNNKAVENVSRELPQCAQIAGDLVDLNYFKTVSNALSDNQDDTWGLIAAVLGNSGNRSAYINKAWWDNESGLRQYFLSITGQVDYELDDNGDPIIPRVIDECDPPEDLEEAKQRWLAARKCFADALTKAENVTAIAQKAYECQKLIYELKERLVEIARDQVDQKEIIETLEIEVNQLTASLHEKETEFEKAEAIVNASKQEKPGFFKRFFARQQWWEWKAAHETALSALNFARKAYKNVENEFSNLNKREDGANKALSILVSKQNTLEKKLESAEAQLEKAASICGKKLVTPSLWQQSHEDQQIFAPNFTQEAQKLRDDVFVEAINLHKAFIDASAKQLRQNLGAYFYCLNGGKLPHDKRALLPHLWSSAFLLTPVISTTFASVGRMLKDLPAESIGWLLIDEAGQATPQAAIGAIYRAKRVMSVGDPLQIEPVVTLPSSLVHGISRYLGVDPDHWMAPETSVQTVSDAANQYGTTIPRDLSEIRIGTPLLVHRRCEDPMFTISNKLAYNGLMVHATASSDSDITKLFGEQSRWFNIEGSAQEKWCPEEGDFVASMLMKACSNFGGDPDIFVISFFRIVAEKMRQRMRSEMDSLASHGIEDPASWIAGNIGTVHTFQGKEAKAIILLLGAPNPTQNGARNWATSNVNLLNVAVSRAKQNFYVVGNEVLWSDLGHMKLVNRYLQ